MRDCARFTYRSSGFLVGRCVGKMGSGFVAGLHSSKFRCNMAFGVSVRYVGLQRTLSTACTLLAVGWDRELSQLVSNCVVSSVNIGVEMQNYKR